MAAYILACALAAWMALMPPTVGQSLPNETLRDSLLRLAASSQEETRLAVVDVSETSLQEIGPWPWPRGKLADLVENLVGPYQAKAVALDMVLPEPGEAAGDARLAALAEHMPLTLAVAFDFSRRTDPIRQGIAGTATPMQTGRPALAATGYVGNHAGLAPARCVGNIGLQPDADGTVRGIPALTRYEGHDYAPLSQALLACGQSRAGAATPAGQAVWRLPFPRQWGAYTVIPAARVLDLSAPAELLRGRYVLIGSSALGLADQVTTPLSPQTPGVFVHAAALSALLDGGQSATPVIGPAGGVALTLAWSVLTLLGACLALARLPAWSSVGLLACLSLAWLGIGYGTVTAGLDLPLIAPLAGYFTLLVVAIPLEWWLAQRESQRILESFAHYVARPVLDELRRQDMNHVLLPTRREITVLIADMEAYTRLTSTLSLEDAAVLTTDFLDCLTRPVLEAGGTLDKYTGDGLVAFWGAPLLCPDQTSRALAASRQILAEVDALNQRRLATGQVAVRVRIGIEQGPAMVGDLGTPFRSAYTAVGDSINFASKLQEAARDLPTRLVIGPNAAAALPGGELISLGRIQIRNTGEDGMEIHTIASELKAPAAA